MGTTSVATLVEQLTALRLLEPAQQKELTQRLSNASPDPRTLARTLVQRGWLTSYQANQLLQGRGQDLVLGQYVLLERLGEGGMGQVFKARHRTLGRIVALKLIRKERIANPDAVKRFHREVRAAAALSHPNIVTAYDADQVGDTHFFAMEYVEGIDLAKLVKNKGPLPIPQACEYIREAALGLQHAFEKGLVHRDIKPANLLVAVSSGRSVVKLLDLGLARLHHADGEDDSSGMLTREGAVMGTPDYIAPEQAMNSHTIDIRADLYSLGCTFYYLLTGRPPFPGGSMGEKLVKHQLTEPDPVEQLRPDVPPQVAAIVRKLLAKKPEDRYQTPAELAAALASEGLLSPGPTGGQTATNIVPPPGGEFATLGPGDTAEVSRRRSRPADRRRRMLFIGGGVGLLVGVVLVLAIARPRPAKPPASSSPEPVAGRVVNSIGMQLVELPAGTFPMGLPATASEAEPDEIPQRSVTISRPFWMSVHEVTQGQFQKVMGQNPSALTAARGGTPNHPVENVTWQEAKDFCDRLSARDAEKQAGRRYRLPTEAEWEYACRADSKTIYSFGNDAAQLGPHAVFVLNADSKPAPVGKLLPNAWGLYDMHGNVGEWCADWYDRSYYRSRVDRDPRGPAGGDYRVWRGGAWNTSGRECRSTYRHRDLPGERKPGVGFRVVMELTK
jgi:formylglycine-generating enzyme required for sulfatase activity/tRNA A-37 threonylcarbamoyl transferase component Bud32